MRRREFITFLGSAAGWPLAAPAQTAPLPVIGLLFNGTPEALKNYLAMFQKGLMEAGFIEGRTVAIEYRFAENHNERLPGLAADLVRAPARRPKNRGRIPCCIDTRPARLQLWP